MYILVDVMRQRLAGRAQVVAYGHLGDGNLHLNVFADKHTEELLLMIEPFVYEWTRNQKGSVSAEHGIGVAKANYLSYSKTRESIQMMRQMKKLFDPNDILNPGKLFIVEQ